MTGQRYPHRLLSAGGGNKNSGSMTGGAGTGVDGDTTPQYQVIGCAFNHRCFYARRCFHRHQSVALLLIEPPHLERLVAMDKRWMTFDYSILRWNLQNVSFENAPECLPPLI